MDPTSELLNELRQDNMLTSSEQEGRRTALLLGVVQEVQKLRAALRSEEQLSDLLAKVLTLSPPGVLLSGEKLEKISELWNEALDSYNKARK